MSASSADFTLYWNYDAGFAVVLTYVLLSTLAGVGYGAAYHVTGRVEAGMLVHFLLNLTHLFLFTYPFAA